MVSLSLSLSLSLSPSHYFSIIRSAYSNLATLVSISPRRYGNANGSRLPVHADFRVSQSGSLFRRRGRLFHEGSSLVQHTLRLIRIDVCETMHEWISQL